MKKTAMKLAIIGLTLSLSAAPALASTGLVVLVASNATASTTEVAEAYQKTHPDVKILIWPASSKVIATQVERGAEADLVLISKAVADGTKGLETPAKIFSNHTVVSINKTSKIKTAKDLASAGVRLVGGTSGSVQYEITDETINNLGKTYGANFAKKAKENIQFTKTSSEQAEKAVEDGVVDAGIVFAADAATNKTIVLDLGDKTVVAQYVTAMVTTSKNATQVKDLVTFMNGNEAQAIFRKHHHDPVK